jgi:hypothetical protein
MSVAAIVALNNNTAKTVVPEYYHIKKNEMNGARSTYDGEEKCMQSFGGGNLRKRDHLDDPDVDGRMILKWIFREWGVGVWTGLIWLRIGIVGGHFVNAVMNIRVP